MQCECMIQGRGPDPGKERCNRPATWRVSGESVRAHVECDGCKEAVEKATRHNLNRPVFDRLGGP